MAISIENADELLSTTRAVRDRLDTSRPVPREVLLECIALSQQSPSGQNRQSWRWIVVTDPAKRAELAEIYRDALGDTIEKSIETAQANGDHNRVRMSASVKGLANRIQDMPALVVPCIQGRMPTENSEVTSTFFASIYPAVWSFNLALRARGLGTVFGTVVLRREKEFMAALGIPDDVTPALMLPVAYTVGNDFKPANRPPPETITFWNGWGQTDDGGN